VKLRILDQATELKNLNGLCAATRNLKKFHALCMNCQRSFRPITNVQTNSSQARTTPLTSRQSPFAFSEILSRLSQDAGPGAGYEYVQRKSSLHVCFSSSIFASTILTHSGQTPRVVIDKPEEKLSSQILQQPKRELRQQPLQAWKQMEGKARQY
jgi:hypothetical protein